MSKPVGQSNHGDKTPQAMAPAPVAEFSETPIIVCLTFERDMCEASSCRPRRLVRVPSSRQGLSHRLSLNHQINRRPPGWTGPPYWAPCWTPSWLEPSSPLQMREEWVVALGAFCRDRHGLLGNFTPTPQQHSCVLYIHFKIWCPDPEANKQSKTFK